MRKPATLAGLIKLSVSRLNPQATDQSLFMAVARHTGSAWLLRIEVRHRRWIGA